jgi:DNA-binding transcriptional MerR regulator
MSSASLLTIRRLSQRTGITLRALRHYESVGLLNPIRAGRGERLYPHHECTRAAQIAKLRQLDLPLSLIQRIIDQESQEQRDRALKSALTERLARLEQQAPLIKRALCDFDWDETSV